MPFKPTSLPDQIAAARTQERRAIDGPITSFSGGAALLGARCGDLIGERGGLERHQRIPRLRRPLIRIASIASDGAA